MKRKGFTLIELLAVIVILAVIMVVAVPKILDIIESSRKSAFENSYKLVSKAIKTQIASSNIVETDFEKNESGCYEFDFTNNNDNVQNLQVKNKENFDGSISYCNNQISYNNFTDGHYTINEKTVSKNDGETEISKDITIYKDGTLYQGGSIVATHEYTYPITYDFSSYNYLKVQKNPSYPTRNSDLFCGTSEKIDLSKKYVLLKTNRKINKTADNSYGYYLTINTPIENYYYTDGTDFYVVCVIPEDMKTKGILELYYWVSNTTIDTEEVRISEIRLTDNLPTGMTEY